MDGKQKKPSGSTGNRRPKAASGGSAQRKKPVQKVAAKPRTAAPQKKAEQVSATPDVVYLPPKPFSRNRLLLRLASVAAVVFALVLGLSVFFKVDKITVSGNNKYGAWDIREASGIENGGNLLTFSRAKAAGKIIKALPYVKSVRIGIKLPDTVMIDVVEVEVTYVLEARNGECWLVSAEGKAVAKCEEQEPQVTRINGVYIEVPKLGEQVKAMETAAPTDEAGNPVPVTVTAAQRLATALDIAQYMERNGIIGGAASISVADMGALEVWYGTRYQMLLGNSTDLSHKIYWMKNVIDNMADYAGGVVDLSDPNDIQYDPF